MQVCLKFNRKNLTNSKINVIRKFVLFLNKEFPLKKDVVILFTDKTEEGMTTG